MKQIKKDNVKKVLAAAGKFAGKKVVPTFGLAAALTLLPAPLSAQESPRQGSINNNYNPIVGQLTRAYVIQVWYDKVSLNKENDIYIIDVDGNPGTINDQKLVFTPKQYIGNNRLRVGDKVQFIESNPTILERTVSLNYITKVH